MMLAELFLKISLESFGECRMGWGLSAFDMAFFGILTRTIIKVFEHGNDRSWEYYCQHVQLHIGLFLTIEKAWEVHIAVESVLRGRVHPLGIMFKAVRWRIGHGWNDRFGWQQSMCWCNWSGTEEKNASKINVRTPQWLWFDAGLEKKLEL